MRRHATDPAAIEAEIAQLRSLARDAARRHWRVVFGRTPPADLSRDMLRRVIAWRLQERAFGGLDTESLRLSKPGEMHAKTIRGLVLLAALSLFCTTVAWAVDHSAAPRRLSDVCPRWLVETGLLGWAGKIRTEESVRELCLCHFVVTCVGSVKARRQRPFAFELVRREYAADGFCGSKSGLLSPTMQTMRRSFPRRCIRKTSENTRAIK